MQNLNVGYGLATKLPKTAGTPKTEMTAEIANGVAAFVEILSAIIPLQIRGEYENERETTMIVENGRRYLRIWKADADAIERGKRGSAFAFVDKTNGDVLKPASWKTPAKHARGNVVDASWIGRVGPFGPEYLTGDSKRFAFLGMTEENVAVAKDAVLEAVGGSKKSVARAIEVLTVAIVDGFAARGKTVVPTGAKLVVTDAPIAELAPIARTQKVGDVLCSSWGYEQTNVDFYMVAAVTPTAVRLFKLDKTTVANPNDATTVLVTPRIESTTPADAKKCSLYRVRAHENGYAVQIESYSSASLWNGEPCRETAWGYGH